MTPDIRYRPDIDGLRAIAILAVVAYHAGLPGFGGGFVGVDVFFVISGFLITRLLVQELKNTGTISLRDFYARRIRRLFPALAVVLISVVVLFAIVFPGLGDSRRFAISVRWAAMGLANVFYKRNTGGYFDGPTVEMPLLHLWSLAVEEQFYLVWPLLLLLVGQRWFKWALLLLVPASLWGAHKLIGAGNASEAFYLMPWRAWELGIGAFLVGLPPGRLPRWLREIAGVAGLGAIAFAVVRYSSATLFPGLSALLPVLGSALVIGSGEAGGFVSRTLSFGPLVRIGLLSYGWYLWHWPLLALAHARSFGQDPGLGLRAGLIALSLALAAASMRWIEGPIRQGRFWRSIRPLHAIGVGLAANGVFVLLGFAVPMFEIRALSMKLGGRLVEQVLEQTSAHECFEQKKIGLPMCNYSFAPKDTRAPTIVAWGDSHACSYFPMIEDYARQNHLNAAPYCSGNTPPFVGKNQVSGRETDASAFGTFAEAVVWDLKHKITAGPVAAVLVSRWGHYEAMSPVELGSKLRSTAEELARLGVGRILVVLPYPEFKVSTLRCLLSADLTRCSRPGSEVEAERLPIVNALRAAVAGLTHVRLLDPLPVVCDGQSCPQVLDGIPVVYDDNHPTVAAASKIGVQYRADLDWLTGR